MSDIISLDGKTVIKCHICGFPMTQSKNDSELFLCYRCNERTFKSQLKVEQIVVPKRQTHTISYKDDFVDSAFVSANERDVIVEPEINPDSFSLQSGEYPNAYDILDLTKEVQKIKIKEQFEKVLPDAKIKVDLEDH